MKKPYQNLKKKEGFSLVELVIVIAIMAILIAILVPQFIKYVERSRVAKDETNADELLRAVEIALADEQLYTTVTGGSGSVTLKGGVVTFSPNTFFVSGGSPINRPFIQAVADTLRLEYAANSLTISNDKLRFLSKVHTNTGANTFIINIVIPSNSTDNIIVHGTWG